MVLSRHQADAGTDRAVSAGLGGSGAGGLQRTREVPSVSGAGARESVAVVVVTYNRADLLRGLLDGLTKLDKPADAVIVVDNASTDHTAEVLAAATTPNLQVITSEKNLGGAGGFHIGTKAALEQGFDRAWLMDDDVVPAPDCLEVLLAQDEDCLFSVREDTRGDLIELAAVRFDLRNPLAIKPKTASVMDTYPTRADMPERVEVEVVAFEGFMVRTKVLREIGLPDPSYFIFYDDADLAIRARRAGHTIWAVRDAVLVRQLDFNQQHDLAGWKGYYMYRNLFAVHFRYGENALVRAKPWLITAAVVLLSPVRGGRKEAANVTRALRDARGMKHLSTSLS
ncbi:MAG: glycosyltransferase [Nocardioides sp.]|nr:glycosyltransferase [Nocardioides sp.]